jgi:phage portal protein BeeE
MASRSVTVRFTLQNIARVFGVPPRLVMPRERQQRLHHMRSAYGRKHRNW